MIRIRPAAVAGSFYPDGAAALGAAVERHLHRAALASANAAGDTPARHPKLLLVPHAGYAYSGDVAASAYARLLPWRGSITRVVLLGPAHRVALHGLAAPADHAFETPLGTVRVDRAALASLSDLPQLQFSDRAHALEHSLEVQLPFLQATLGTTFTLVPLAVGDASPQDVDEVLEALWGGDETLIVVSSDLSHYLPRAIARERDSRTVQRILAFASDLRGDEACGAAVLNGALRTARRHGLKPQLLDLRNSADTAGGSGERVVGYAAISFDAASSAPRDTPDRRTDDAVLGQALLAIARSEIATALDLRAPEAPQHPDLARLRQPGASFVTLHDARGDLRGCVGHVEAVQPLQDDVRQNALAAAFSDRRFAPLSATDWPGLRVSVSVLGALQPLPACASFDEAAALLRPGVDGVLLDWQGRRGTLLPQVWAHRPEGRAFLAALLHKAGLAADFWSADIRLQRYGVTVFDEGNPSRPH